MLNFKIYLTILASLMVLDTIWLKVISGSLYQSRLGHLFADKFTLWPAAIFYVIYALGILILAVLPALTNHSLAEALIKGLMIGLISYAAYDLTNQATLRDWPLSITLLDLLWGTFMTGLASFIAYTIFK